MTSEHHYLGIPPVAFEFYEQLSADPTKPWWEAHKETYNEAVRAPLVALGESSLSEFGPYHLYRPYRDVRFSADKTPYKNHQGMFVELRNGLGWYVQVSATGLMVAGGWYRSTTAQVARYRDAVAQDSGAHVVAAFVADLESTGLLVDGEQLKSRPRGIAADHPHLDWLRYRTLYATRTWPPQSWMGRANAYGRIQSEWRRMRPFLEWLSEVVGPGESTHTTGGQDGLHG